MQGGIAHGGRLIEARRLFPHAPAPFIDLSTGINPCPYPVGSLPDTLFTRLPEPEALDALQSTAAEAYGTGDPAVVVAAPGTQILISLLPHLLGHGHATILGPTYAEHEAAWRAAGAQVVEEHTPDTFLRTATQVGGAAILCNPNNPDGRRCDAGTLLALADTMARKGGVLVCDEAFADLEAPDPGLAPYLPRSGLLILRSFGKSYGLAGLRLGFLLASPELARRIRIALGPWAVSGPALAVGRAALADQAWRHASAARLQRGGDRLDAMLGAAGFGCAGGTRLFRLFRGSAARTTFRCLGEAGLLTRRFAHDPDLLRFGLPGSKPDWRRLQAALADLTPRVR
jgi:cobalamin biosynthetic protein CobC